MEIQERKGATDPYVFVSIETTAYSGATLLSFLLGAHPEVATIGEMDGLLGNVNAETYLCSCGRRIRECEFWHDVAQRMIDRGFPFDVAHFDTALTLGASGWVSVLRRGFLRVYALESLRDKVLNAWPSERRRLRALVARNEALVEAVLDVTGKNVFVDSSKQRWRLRSLHRHSNLDLRAVHLVRDVRGVVASELQRKSGVSIREAARRWVKAHRRIEATLSPWLNGKYIRVLYEEICAQPALTLQRLYRFCGVDAEIELHVNDFRKTIHHIVGNRMRLASITEIKTDELWRELLSAKDLRAIKSVAAESMRRYGYLE